MNIKKALKLKNKLTGEIKELIGLASSSNSIIKGNPRKYSTIQLLKEAETKTAELIELKTKIHLANSPVYSKIFKLSELKSRAKFISAIPTDEGKTSSRYGTESEMMEVEMDVIQMKEFVKKIEEEIERIQEELDVHNAVTEI